jgi:hypothetical protein
MFNSKIVTSLLILVFFIGSSFAQSSSKTGIGVALIDLQKLFEFSASEGVGANATITVPFILSPSFRLEPEVGYFSASQKADINGTTYEESSVSLSIGAGIFPQNVYGDFTLYYGGRVGYTSQKLTEEAGTSKEEVTTSGFYIAPAVGGEHNFSDHFSIGAEAQIVYASLTNEEDNRDYDVDLSLLNTRVLVFFRFYF